MLASGASLAVLGILLPTLIHVSLFTLVFMALGALRSGQQVQWVLIAIYLAAIALILVVPPTGRDPGAGIRQGGAGIFRQRGARARPAVRHSGSEARHPAREPARLRLHLPLPQLVHQSRGDPLGRHFARAARARRGGERRLRPRSISTTTRSASACCWRSAWRISCWNFRSTAWRCASSARRSARASRRPCSNAPERRHATAATCRVPAAAGSHCDH